MSFVLSTSYVHIRHRMLDVRHHVHTSYTTSYVKLNKRHHKCTQGGTGETFSPALEPPLRHAGRCSTVDPLPDWAARPRAATGLEVWDGWTRRGDMVARGAFIPLCRRSARTYVLSTKGDGAEISSSAAALFKSAAGTLVVTTRRHVTSAPRTGRGPDWAVAPPAGTDVRALYPGDGTRQLPRPSCRMVSWRTEGGTCYRPFRSFRCRSC